MKASPRQRDDAITALVSCATLAEAAQAASVDTSTLRRWLRNDEEFIGAYSEARRAALDERLHQATSQLSELVPVALHTLVTVMNNAKAPPTARVSAAGRILDTYWRAREYSDVEARMAELERHMKALEGGGNGS